MQKPTSEKAPRSRGAAEDSGAVTGGGSECLRGRSGSPRARAEVAAAALLQVSLRGLRRAVGKKLHSFKRRLGAAGPPGNMWRAWILLTLGLLACVSAESVSRPGEGRARRLGCPRPSGVRRARGNRGAPPGASHRPTPPHAALVPRGAPGTNALAPPSVSTFPSCRKAPLAGVAPRSLGMRAQESQFCQTAEAPKSLAAASPWEGLAALLGKV